MRKRPSLNEAQRQAKREVIQRTKPWEKSTGPTTTEGRKKSAQRWRRHGLRSKEALAIKEWMRSIKTLVNALNTLALLIISFSLIAILVPSNFNGL